VTYLAAALITIAFLLCFRLSGIVAASARAIDVSRRALAVMQEPTTSEDAKEQAIRGFSIQLFGLFASITARGVLLLAVPAVLIAGFSFIGLASFDEVIELLASWEAILAVTVAVIILLWLQQRWR